MDISFVHSLEHLSSVKVVTSLLNDNDVILQWDTEEENYDRNKFIITENISKLIPGSILKTKLETFVAPILSEVKQWTDICELNWVGLKRNNLPVIDTIRQCWLSDGSIDQEKAAKILVKNSDASPLGRFIFACIYCLFDDVLNLWEMLSKIEKAFLRHRYFTLADDQNSIIRRWIEWLDSSRNKDWESCAVWILETPLWKNNVHILKRVLQTMSPIEKSEHLLKVLLEEDVRSDVMRFGLQIMSRDEQKLVLRESPLKVFKSFLSWPSRGIFVDMADKSWLYITSDTFCSILTSSLDKIRNESKDYEQLVEILKRFWAQSPGHCKKAAEESSIARSLTYVLEHEPSKPFPRRGFLNCYNPVDNHLSTAPIIDPNEEEIRFLIDPNEEEIRFLIDPNEEEIRFLIDPNEEEIRCLAF